MPPTAEQCADPVYMATGCGQAFMYEWNAALNAKNASLSVCASYNVSFNRAGELSWNTEPASTPRTVLDFDDESGVIANKSVETVKSIGAMRDMQYAADPSAYHSLEAWEDAQYHRTDWLGVVRRIAIEAKRDMWNANGTAVDDCREYVHEKYYDYQAYRDEVRERGSSYRDYYDAAFAGHPRLGIPDYAIGTRALLDQPLEQKNNVPLGLQPDLSAQHPLNDFFILKPTPGLTPTPNFYSPEVAPYVSQAAKDSCGGSLYGNLNVCDPTLQQILHDGGQISVVRDWQWHANQNALAIANGFIDEHLYASEDLKARYRTHLRDRHRAMQAVQDFVKEIGPDTDIATELGIEQELINPMDPIGQKHEDGKMLIGDSTGFQNYAAPIIGKSKQVAPKPKFPGALQTPVHRLDYLASKVAEADYWLEQDLLEAQAMGCLELRGANPCNWSPLLFAQSMTDIYMPDKEADYDRCLRNTGRSSFDSISGRSLSITQNPGTSYESSKYATLPKFGGGTYACTLQPDGTLVVDPDSDGVVPPPASPTGWDDWTGDTDRLDQYFQCLAAFKAMLIDEASEIADLQDECGKLQLADSDAKYELMGNEDWGLDYGYGFGWEMGGFADYAKGTTTTDDCQMSPEVYGYFDAGANALGFHIPFVHASGHVTTNAKVADDLPVKPHIIEFLILGTDVFAPVDTNMSSIGANLVSDEIRHDSQLFFVKVPFSIGPVPMSISGGISGYVGIDYSVDLSVMGASCAEPGIAVVVGPKAGVEGFATLAVDAFIIEAGVKIALQIIEISMPFTAGLRLKVLNTEPAITFNLNLSAHLATLGGRFAIYLRILTETWEWDLFTWDGLSWDFPLFDADVNIPIEPLAMAMQELESTLSNAVGCAQ